MTARAFLEALPLPRAVEEPERCPGCGQARGLVAESGEVGCPACYDVFSSTLAALRRPAPTPPLADDPKSRSSVR